MARLLVFALGLLSLVSSPDARADCTSTTPTALPSGPACSAAGADCTCLSQVTTVCQPTGGILDAFAGRGGCVKFGKPLLPVRPRLAFGGIYQEFENGEIAAYPNWAGATAASMPGFVISGVNVGPKIEVEWGSTSPFNYEFFVLRWDKDDHAANVEGQHKDDKQQKDVMQSGTGGKHEFDSGGHWTYVIYVEGCKKSGFLFLSWASCKQGWSHPVYVDVLMQLADPIPHPAAPPIVIPAGILDVPDQVSLNTNQLVAILDDQCHGDLIEAKDEHKGEIATNTMLAQLHTASLGWSCAGKSWQMQRVDINKALHDAVVVTKPGTDPGEVILRVLGALGGAAAGVLLGAALVTLLGGAPSIIGIVATVAGAVVGAILGNNLDKRGDYDMRLTGLIQIVHRFPTEISASARDDLIHNLLTVRGGADERRDFVWIAGIPTPILETENHAWMTESARFLTNNLLADEYKKKGQAVPKEYDNDKNGMTDWMLDGLRGFLIHDFYELNSRPYGTYIAQALNNLAEYGAYGTACTQVVPPGAPPSPRSCDVRRAARNVLDFLATKFAVSSNELRRAVPFRRQPPFRNYSRLLTNGGDDLTWRYFEYTVGSDFIHSERHSRIMEYAPGELLLSLQSNYAPPILVTDLIRSTVAATSTSLQRFRDTRRDADVVEIYYRDPAFLISAGGKIDRGSGVAWLFSDEDAWALPTTLMPTKQGNDYRDFVRIAGHTDDLFRVNTCVGPGFACGMNPTLPPGLPATCMTTSGNWTFIDFDANTPACPFAYGYYVAFYREECSTASCALAATKPDTASTATPSFGFFEATPYRSFASYVADVLAANGSWDYRFDKINLYMRPLGGRVTFVLNNDAEHWGIVDYDLGNGVVTPERRYDRWPVASGDIMNAPLDGCINIDNQHLQQRLILDHTDVNRPRRTILPLPPPRGCTCPLPDRCIGPRAE